MSSLNILMFIGVFLFWNSHVHSKKPTVLSKTYNFGNQQLVLGKPYFDNPKLIYALCKRGLDNPKKKCIITVEEDAFDSSKRSYTCNIKLKTQLKDGFIHDVLEVTFWGNDKAIFVWREVTLQDFEHAWVMIQTIHMESCESSIQKLIVDIREDEKPEIFFIRSQYSYDVIFNYKELCHDMYCKLTVHENGTAENPIPWLPITGLLYGLESVEYDSTVYHFAITIENFENKTVNFFVKRETEWHELTTFKNIVSLAWSTSHGIFSACSCGSCAQFDYQNRFRKQINLLGVPQQYEISALYNLPSREYLVLFHDKSESSSSESNYHITKIDINGKLGKLWDIKDLRRPLVLASISAEFFEDSSMGYCLSVFHPEHSFVTSNTKFSKYCFSIEDLS